MLCWLDLETDGLDPKKNLILEIGLILTDDKLNELGRFSRVIHFSRRNWKYLEPVVLEMHRASKLLDECDREQAFCAETEMACLAFLAEYDVPRGVVPLCGSTIGFDRSFLREHMPALLRYFHYRSLDVSTLTELARRWYPSVYETRPGASDKKPHRALADLENSIAALKYYWGEMFV